MKENTYRHDGVGNDECVLSYLENTKACKKHHAIAQQLDEMEVSVGIK